MSSPGTCLTGRTLRRRGDPAVLRPRLTTPKTRATCTRFDHRTVEDVSSELDDSLGSLQSMVTAQ